MEHDMIQLLFVLDIVGTVAFAVSGAMVAAKSGVSASFLRKNSFSL